MLLGWLGAALLIRVELLLFWMALVPRRGRELVLCCRTDTEAEALGMEVRTGFSGRSSSSESLARTVVSGTLLRRP